MVSTPYGIRDIKLTPYTDAAGTVLSTNSVDLPYARTLSFSEVEDFNELRGDDRVVAQHGSGPTVEFDLESGGIDFAAYKVMAGGTIEETGTSGSIKRVFSKKTTDQRPWFKVEGQAIADSGGDVHAILYKCKCTGDLTGEFTDGEFFLTQASGVGIGDVDDNLYDFVENEQVTPIVGGARPPVIESITPEGVGAGDAVTIVGEHFTGATAVTFGAGSPGTALVVLNDKTISVKLPAGSAGTVQVTVSSPAGVSEETPYLRG